MEFKEQLKKYRLKKGFTQEALAKKVFVSRSAIAKWEAGLGIPSEESLLAICRVLEIEKEDLLPNKELEPLLVEKNIKLKKKNLIALVLAVVLAISVGLLSFFIIRDYNEAKEISKLTPRIERIYFEDKEHYDRVDRNFLLFANEYEHLLIDVSFDERLDFSNLKITIEGAECFSCNVISVTASGDRKIRTYKAMFRVVEEVSELKITSATYSFYDRADKNKYKTADCDIIAKPLPVKVSKTRTANVRFVFNADEIMTFEIGIGESITDAIFNVGKQEELLNDFITNKYPQLNNKVLFEGWERADGEKLYDRIYNDVTVNAVVNVKPSVTFNVEVRRFGCGVFNTMKPMFLLDGQEYENVLYELESDSDCVEIVEKREIKGAKPGTAMVFVKYDLGFYSGECNFSAEINDIVGISVLGYRKKISEGTYTMGVKGYYNSETGTADLTEQSRQELIDYFNKQNEVFYLATGFERKFVGFKRISDLEMMPVFETEYVFDDSVFELTLSIGSHYIYVNKGIQPIVERVEDVKMTGLGYSSIGEIYYTWYLEKDGVIIDKGRVKEDMEEITLCVALCFEFEGISYYKTYKIPVTLIE